MGFFGIPSIAEQCALDFAKAAKIPAAEYTGWICESTAHGSGTTEYGYHSSIDNFLDALARAYEPMPPFVWATTTVRLALNARDFVESACESQEHHEDAFDQISEEALDDLQTVMDAWLKREDVNVCSYMEDRSRAIILGDKERERMNVLKDEHEAERKRLAEECPDLFGDDSEPKDALDLVNEIEDRTDLD